MSNIYKIKNLFPVLITIFLVLSFVSCTSDNKTELPKKGAFPDVELTNYDGSNFYFKDLKGKVLVVSYIYTNCPDICHMISKKLNKFKSEMDPRTLDDVTFVSVSFDPTRDTPKVLSEHLEKMDLDLENWYFVTGRRDRVYETLAVAGIDPMLDSMEDPDTYTMNHRDRISIVDKNGQIRKHYKGTGFDHRELKDDIKELL